MFLLLLSIELRRNRKFVFLAKQLIAVLLLTFLEIFLASSFILQVFQQAEPEFNIVLRL